MAIMFQENDFIILDASLFVAPFSQDLKDSLIKKETVWVAETFHTEMYQYRSILKGERKEYYEDNINFVTNRIRVKEFLTDSKSKDISNYAGDSWGLINCCLRLIQQSIQSGQPSKEIVVVTANEVLISRIVLNDLPVKIYNLNNNMLYRSSTLLSSIGENGRISQFSSSEIINEDIPKINTDNEVLYSSKGQIRLGAELKSGLEAIIYTLKDDSRWIVKLFKKGQLTKNKYVNLLNLIGINSVLKIDWAQFPEEFVYYDKEKIIPAGIIEKYVETSENLGDNQLYMANLDDEDTIALTKITKISDSIDLCIKVVRQVCYLNCFGFYISDYNMDNFAFLMNNREVIQMWDTDSFGFKDFFSGLCPWGNLSRDYDLTLKMDAIELCNEALCAFVFSILSLGDAPIGKKGGFKYDNSQFPGAWKKELIPEKTFIYLRDVFTRKQVASPSLLLDYLVQDRNTLKNENGDSYYSVLIDRYMPSDEISIKEVQKPIQSNVEIIWKDLVFKKILICSEPIKPVLARKLQARTIRNAISSYAPSLREEEVLAILDTSLIKNGRQGVIFTDKGIYSNLHPNYGLFLPDKMLPYSMISLVEPYEEEPSYDMVITLKNHKAYPIRAGKAKDSLLYILAFES